MYNIYLYINSKYYIYTCMDIRALYILVLISLYYIAFDSYIKVL